MWQLIIRCMVPTISRGFGAFILKTEKVYED